MAAHRGIPLQDAPARGPFASGVSRLIIKSARLPMALCLIVLLTSAILRVAQAQAPENTNNLIIVIDNSASMRGDWLNPGNDPKDFRHQGAALAVSLLKPGFKLGIISFSEKANVLYPMQEVKGKKEKEDAIRAMNDKPGNWTNFLDALNAARQMIDSAARGEGGILIFLTDGENNRPPNSEGRVLEAVEQLAAGGWRIAAMGLTQKGQTQLLQEMATRSRGAYYEVDKADDLVTSYLEIMNDIQNYVKKPWKDEPVALAEQADQLAFVIFREREAKVRDLELDGKSVDFSGEGIFRGLTDDFDIVYLQGPSAGVWRLVPDKPTQVGYVMRSFPAWDFVPGAPPPRVLDGQAAKVALTFPKGLSEKISSRIRFAALLDGGQRGRFDMPPTGPGAYSCATNALRLQDPTKPELVTVEAQLSIEEAWQGKKRISFTLSPPDGNVEVQAPSPQIMAIGQRPSLSFDARIVSAGGAGSLETDAEAVARLKDGQEVRKKIHIAGDAWQKQAIDLPEMPPGAYEGRLTVTPADLKIKGIESPVAVEFPKVTLDFGPEKIDFRSVDEGAADARETLTCSVPERFPASALRASLREPAPLEVFLGSPGQREVQLNAPGTASIVVGLSTKSLREGEYSGTINWELSPPLSRASLSRAESRFTLRVIRPRISARPKDLPFGTLTPENSGEKTLTVTLENGREANVSIAPEKPIPHGWEITCAPNEFRLDANARTKEVRVSLVNKGAGARLENTLLAGVTGQTEKERISITAESLPEAKLTPKVLSFLSATEMPNLPPKKVGVKMLSKGTYRLILEPTALRLKDKEGDIDKEKVTVSPKELEISGNEEREVSVGLRVPDDTFDGHYEGAIEIQWRPAETDQRTKLGEIKIEVDVKH